MPAKYWIKLYHEILYDRKMATMNSELWRRTIELFLLAGETGDDGTLPPMEDIAWKLRVDPEQLETEMIELQRLNILSKDDTGWYVTKFKERQEPLPKSEYMKRKRNEDRLQTYYQPVTNSNDLVTQIRGEEIRGEEIHTRVEEKPPSYSSSDEQEARASDEFTAMQIILETCTGLPATQGDIDTIRECLKNKVIEADIRAALAWRVDNRLNAVKVINQLLGGILTARNMRIQGGNARRASKEDTRTPGEKYKLPEGYGDWEPGQEKDPQLPINGKDAEHWHNWVSDMQRDTPKANFDTYIAPLWPARIADNILYICVQDNGAKQWLESRILSTARRYWEAWGLKVEFEVTP